MLERLFMLMAAQLRQVVEASVADIVRMVECYRIEPEAHAPVKCYTMPWGCLVTPFSYSPPTPMGGCRPCRPRRAWAARRTVA